MKMMDINDVVKSSTVTFVPKIRSRRRRPCGDTDAMPGATGSETPPSGWPYELRGRCGKCHGRDYWLRPHDPVPICGTCVPPETLGFDAGAVEWIKARDPAATES